jgi:exodeoxyribonuclease V alpha subunit
MQEAVTQETVTQEAIVDWRKGYSESPPSWEDLAAQGGNTSAAYFAETLMEDLGLQGPGSYWLLYLICEREQKGHIAHSWRALGKDWLGLWDTEAPLLEEFFRADSWKKFFPSPKKASEAAIWYIPEQDSFYTEKGWAFQTELVQAVSSRLTIHKGQTKDSLSADWASFWAKSVNHGLDEGQRAAVEKALGKSLFIVSGGPGTGKTTTLKAIIQSARQFLGLEAEDIALLAPTGRAAQRIGQSLTSDPSSEESSELWGNIQPSTVQRLLGLRPFRNAAVHYHQQAKLPQRLVVVDEASMLDLRLFGQLLSALEAQTMLVLVGDKDQLPSVDSGAVLGDLLAVLDQWSQGRNHYAFLEKVYRSKGAVIQAARSIAQFQKDQSPVSSQGQLEMFGQETPLIANWREGSEEGFFYRGGMEDKDPEQIAGELWQDLGFDRLAALAQAHSAHENQEITPQEFSQALEEGIILANIRGGLWGTRYFNRLLAEVLSPTWPSIGMPLLVTANDPDLGIYNGDRGLIVQDRTEEQGLAVVFALEGQLRSVPLGLIQAWDPGWAMTVHKAQGSEYRKVALLLSAMGRGNMTREILYTGVTRAKEECQLWAEEEVLKESLENRTQRDSGIVAGILYSLGEN